MKKTIKINLGGVVYHIDEDAYDLLRTYLDQLESRFSKSPGGSEILSDIETRMAELFQGKLTSGKEVISLADAKEIISIMGEPEEIGEGDQEEEAVPRYSQGARRGRRMYRDPDSKVVGGVCSGLGAWFNIDPVFIRILFVVFTLTYGAGILIYLILWIGVPEARTSAEKLEMRGEEINISNIERKVRQNYPSDYGLNAGEMQPARRRPSGNAISAIIRVIGKIILVFFKVIGFIIGISLLIAGITILVALIAVAVGGKSWFFDSDLGLNNIGLHEIMNFFINPATGTLGLIALIILVAVPVIALIYGMVKLLFNVRANDKAVGLSAFGIWVIALCFLLILGAKEATGYSSEGQVRDERQFKVLPDKTLNINALPLPEDVDDDSYRFNYRSEFWILRENGDSLNLVIRPRVTIELSPDTTAVVEITKTARGPNYSTAKRYADEVDYRYRFEDSVLLLDPVFRLSQKERFHAQEIRVVVELPVGTRIYLDPKLKYLLYAIKNTEDTWSSDMVGKEWVMTPDGLTRVLSE